MTAQQIFVLDTQGLLMKNTKGKNTRCTLLHICMDKDHVHYDSLAEKDGDGKSFEQRIEFGDLKIAFRKQFASDVDDDGRFLGKEALRPEDWDGYVAAA